MYWVSLAEKSIRPQIMQKKKKKKATMCTIMFVSCLIIIIVLRPHLELQ